jgi:hypothetical protein
LRAGSFPERAVRFVSPSFDVAQASPFPSLKPFDRGQDAATQQPEIAHDALQVGMGC